MVDTNVSDEFFDQFIVVGSDGKVDIRRTLNAFQTGLQNYLKASEEIRPVILNELKAYKRLGEATLKPFVAHALRLPMTTQVQEKIQRTLRAMVDAGEIQYHTSESGSKRGRGTGYSLPETGPVANQNQH